MSDPNPFTPTFGLTPVVPVGREEVIRAFEDALHAGPGAPARALFLVGTRGVGKTVVLNELEDAARKQGWVTVEETALKAWKTAYCLNTPHEFFKPSAIYPQ